jgi:hypothetical protein
MEDRGGGDKNKEREDWVGIKRERGREGKRQAGREGGREGGREEGRERGREGGRDGGRVPFGNLDRREAGWSPLY